MIIDDAMKIIEQEKLENFNLLSERENRENEIVLAKREQCWIVYATDERASKVTGSEKLFITENEAMENFIKRLRALNFVKRH